MNQLSGAIARIPAGRVVNDLQPRMRFIPANDPRCPRGPWPVEVSPSHARHTLRDWLRRR